LIDWLDLLIDIFYYQYIIDFFASLKSGARCPTPESVQRELC